MASTQYDTIGTRYNQMEHQPAAELQWPSFHAVLGDLEDLLVLDLACGTGRHTRHIADAGASGVVGVDISSTMIDGARAATPSEKYTNISYHVYDCTKSFIDSATGKSRFGSFDIVCAAWMLNYASGTEELIAMLSNAVVSLKPGGRFVTMAPNLELDHSVPMDTRYGLDVENLYEVNQGRLDQGHKVRLTAYVTPPVHFEYYHLSNAAYEDAATKAGLINLKWVGPVRPVNDGREASYWDEYFARPHLAFLTGVKSMMLSACM